MLLALATLILSTSGETIALVTAVFAAVAAALSTCVAAWQGLLMKRSERNRTQPIIVAYERSDPIRENDRLVFAVSLANEGAGPAFNIRFGIVLDGFRHAYRARPAGAQGAGDVPRGLGPGGILPKGVPAYQLTIDDIGVSRSAALETRVYWCRYENAFGEGWETENAWRPDEELRIARLAPHRTVH